MKHSVILAGRSRTFTTTFKRTIEDCGLDPSVRASVPAPDVPGLVIVEVLDIEDLEGLPTADPVRPFMVYTGLDLERAQLLPLKEKGLVGVVSSASSTEEVSFLVNKALFYEKIIRRNPRAPADLPVVLRDSRRGIKTHCSMLSRDGMFVVTINPLEAGSECSLEFTLPHMDKPFKAGGRVLYNITINKDLNIIASPNDPFKRLVSHPGMAVLFTDLPDDQRTLIDEYVKTLV